MGGIQLIDQGFYFYTGVTRTSELKWTPESTQNAKFALPYQFKEVKMLFKGAGYYNNKV